MNKQYHAVLFTGCADQQAQKPFGAHKVAHELRAHGFDTLVVNYIESFSLIELEKVLTACVSDRTLFVGISNTFLESSITDTSQKVSSIHEIYNALLPQGHDFDTTLVSLVKSINPFCKIVLGGVKTHRNYQNNLVDYVVIGYADISVVQLAEFLQNKKPIAIKNYKNIYGIQILDDGLAEGFDFNKSSMRWCEDDVIMPGETLPLEISRGCIFSCKFCNYRLNGKASLDYLKQIDKIKSELLHNWHQYQIWKYRLLDDTFNDTEEKIDMMLDMVRELPFRPLFGGYIRLDLLTAKPHTIQKLFDMGLRHMFMGIETFNRESGRIIGKGGDPARMTDTLISMKKTYGDQISLHGSFICGLPGESKKSVLMTMHKILNKDIPLDYVNYHPLEISKKSIHQWESSFNLDFVKYGYREIDPVTYQDSSAVYWQNQHMTFLEAIDLVTKFYAKYRPQFAPLQQALYGSDPNMKNLYKQKLFQHLGILDHVHSEI